MFDLRIKKMREKLSEKEVDGFLVFKPANRAYLSGFTGSTGLLIITQDEDFLLTDFRYIEQARKQAPDYNIVRFRERILDTAKSIVKETGIKSVGFEADYITFKQYEDLKGRLQELSLVPLEGLAEDIRVKKDSDELKLIRKAVKLTDNAFNHILKFVKPGVMESDLAAELEHYMRVSGAEKSSFDTIVASGYRGALPHGIASRKKLENRDLVIMDFGAVYESYCSDMTRTVVVGSASKKQREIYNIVLEAQEKALDTTANDKLCSEVDASAREIINAQGFGENFGHGLGHGVGMEIHERPSLRPNNDEKLESGMVATIEPGIYIEGWGGVRIEDMINVTDKGCEILSGSTKELIEL